MKDQSWHEFLRWKFFENIFGSLRIHAHVANLAAVSVWAELAGPGRWARHFPKKNGVGDRQWKFKENWPILSNIAVITLINLHLEIILRAKIEKPVSETWRHCCEIDHPSLEKLKGDGQSLSIQWPCSQISFVYAGIGLELLTFDKLIVCKILTANVVRTTLQVIGRKSSVLKVRWNPRLLLLQSHACPNILKHLDPQLVC